MEGSRPPGDHSAFLYESAALLDEIFLDRGGSPQRRIEMNQHRNVGEKLGKVIAGEIVPRLMLLHRSANHPSGRNPPMRAADLTSQIADFADLVVRHDNDVLEAYVRSLLQRGLDTETLLLHLMAPAARRLGVLWEADEISFVDVTIGTSRLQQLLHTFTPAPHDHEALDRRALFLPAPGEQHTFGLLMVADFFRKEGWQVRGGMALEACEFQSLIAEQSFALIGFSLSCETLINALCSTIKSVRRLSKNKSVLVIVGGRILAQDPSLRPWVGADLVAADVREALELAESALRNVAPRRGSDQL